MTSRSHALALPVLLVLLLHAAGCGGEDRRAPDAEDLPDDVERVTNPAEGRWGPDERWRLDEALRIGALEGDGPDVWGAVSDVAVDPEGRLYVLESQLQEVRVFGRDGEHLRTFGREGEGPGEIALGAEILISPAGNVWVHDPRNRRFTVFDPAGDHIGSHPLRTVRFLQGHRFATDGSLLQLVGVDRGGEREVVLVRGRVAPDGALHPVDTLRVPEEPEIETAVIRMQQRGAVMAIRAAPLPFLPEAHRVVDPRGFVWTTAVDGSYRLVQHDLTGKPVRVVERAYEPIPVTAEERAEALEPFEGADFDESRVPDVHPPFDAVHVARGGHLWVWRRAGPERMAWDVFGPEGRYLGEVEPPWNEGRFRLLALEDDALYGVWRDTLGVTYVVRLAVEKPGG